MTIESLRSTIAGWSTTRYGATRVGATLTGAILLAFFAWASANFGSIFPLIEYRQWSLPANISVVGRFFSITSIEQSRSFGVFTDSVLAFIFGHNIIFQNEFQIALLTASGLLFALSLKLLAPNSPPALRAAFLIFALFSVGIVDSLSWQATILDKLCLFFSWLVTYLVLRIKLDSITPIKAIITNLVMFAFTFAAYNSKESAFALIPSALLLILASHYKELASGQTAFRLIRRAAALYALPTLYFVAHVAIVLHNRLFVISRGAKHELSGAANFHIYHYFAYLFNSDYFLSAFHLWPSVPEATLNAFEIGICVLAVILVVAIYLLADRGLFLLWLWAFASFCMALSVSLHAAGFPAYYLIVPQFYLGALLFLTYLVVWNKLRNAELKIPAIAACGALLAVYLAGFNGDIQPYGRIIRMSKNFGGALSRVAEELSSRSSIAHVVFYWPQDDNKVYMFLQPSTDRQLAPFINMRVSGNGTQISDADISDIPYNVEPHVAPKAGEIDVVFGEELRVDGLVAGQ